MTYLLQRILYCFNIVQFHQHVYLPQSKITVLHILFFPERQVSLQVSRGYSHPMALLKAIWPLPFIRFTLVSLIMTTIRQRFFCHYPPHPKDGGVMFFMAVIGHVWGEGTPLSCWAWVSKRQDRGYSPG